MAFGYAIRTVAMEPKQGHSTIKSYAVYGKVRKENFE